MRKVEMDMKDIAVEEIEPSEADVNLIIHIHMLGVLSSRIADSVMFT
jgi:hypothetical protein